MGDYVRYLEYIFVRAPREGLHYHAVVDPSPELPRLKLRTDHVFR